VKYRLLLITLLLSTLTAWSDAKEFVRDHTYTAGDADSKISSRQMALQEVKRELLNEIGIYIYSRIDISENSIGETDAKQEIRTVTAGFVKTDVLEEKWNGYEFYIKARMTADPEEIQNRIKSLASTENENIKLKEQLNQSAEVNKGNRLKMLELKKALLESKSDNEKQKLALAYAQKSKDISANELYEKGFDFTWGTRGENIDHNEAIKWYKKAAEKGHSTAEYIVYLAYYSGKGVKQNYEKAAEGMKKLANLGVTNAQYQLSLMFRGGHGVQRSYEQEMYWLIMAAEQDHFLAHSSLADRYSAGGGMPKNTKKPIFWLIASAEQGDEFAQYDLAIKYMSGRGIDQNRRVALYWLSKAADQGHTDALCYFGMLYYQGEGVEKNIPKASYWFDKAAAKGKTCKKESKDYV